MNNFTTITTDRLLLSRLEINDRDDFFRYRSLPEVYKYQSFMPKNVAEVDDFIRDTQSNPNNIRSIKILEKLGMRKEAHFIKSYRMGDMCLDDCIYAMLKDEWKA